MVVKSATAFPVELEGLTCSLTEEEAKQRIADDPVTLLQGAQRYLRTDYRGLAQ